MRKFISMIFIMLLYTGMSFAQGGRVTIQEYANSAEYIWGSSDATSTDSLNGGVNADTLRVVVKVGDSHFFTLFLDVDDIGYDVANQPDSCGFGIYYAPNWDIDATVSTESNFNYWKVGDTGPKLLTTWTIPDSCNDGRHYVSFNFPSSSAMPVNAAVEILLIATAQNDSSIVTGILDRGR